MLVSDEIRGVAQTANPLNGNADDLQKKLIAAPSEIICPNTFSDIDSRLNKPTGEGTTMACAHSTSSYSGHSSGKYE